MTGKRRSAHTWDGDHRTSNAAGGRQYATRCSHWYDNLPELCRARSRAALEHVHNRTNKAVAIFDQLAITGEIEGLKKQTKPSLYEHLITVKTEGETKLSLVKQLHYLNKVLARITNSNKSGGRLVPKISDNDGAVDKRLNVIVSKRLPELVRCKDQMIQKLTRIGARLLVTFVLGLSCANVSFR